MGVGAGPVLHICGAGYDGPVTFDADEIGVDDGCMIDGVLAYEVPDELVVEVTEGEAVALVAGQGIKSVQPALEAIGGEDNGGVEANFGHNGFAGALFPFGAAVKCVLGLLSYRERRVGSDEVVAAVFL